MIEYTDLTGVDQTTALRVLGIARSIAPCLQSLPTGPERDSAIGILIGVGLAAAQLPKRGIKGQRVGPAGVDYFLVESWFSDDDRAGLRALCGAVVPAPSLPIGQFPQPSRVVSRMWPEEC